MLAYTVTINVEGVAHLCTAPPVGYSAATAPGSGEGIPWLWGVPPPYWTPVSRLSRGTRGRGLGWSSVRRLRPPHFPCWSCCLRLPETELVRDCRERQGESLGRHTSYTRTKHSEQHTRFRLSCWVPPFYISVWFWLSQFHKMTERST